MELSTTPIYADHEYTAVDVTDETVFATDETGAPVVFTRAEWDAMQGGNGGAAVALLALAAGALLIF